MRGKRPTLHKPGFAPSTPGERGRAATVVVPATSANLGCAFDCAALALNRFLKVRAVPLARPGFEIEYRGPLPESIPHDDSNLVAQGFRKLSAWAQKPEQGARLEIDNEIPMGVGLGSSAAAILAGILSGARLCRVKPDAGTVLRLATDLEGHPDNVAAAFHGGFVVSARFEDTDEVLAVRTRVPPALKIVAVIPSRVMPTKEARSVLPTQYSRADAVHNLQRTALLVASAFSGRFDLQPEWFRDRLHQPYRSSLIPGLESCLELRHPDLLGVFLSGAGSSVLALVRKNAAEIAKLLVGEFGRHGLAAQAVFLKAENRGAHEWSRHGVARA
jgi:homoserine kinase